MNPFSPFPNRGRCMVRSEKDLLRQRLLKAEEELDILRPERDKLRQLLSQAEEELDIVRSQKDAFRRLLSEVESKNLQKKLSYVDDYEREKMKRMNLEKKMGPRIQSLASGPSSVSLKRKATSDEILVEDDIVVIERSSINNEELETKEEPILEYISPIEVKDEPTVIELKDFTPEKCEQIGIGNSSVLQSQRLRSKPIFEYISLIEDRDGPAPKRQKLGDSNENAKINYLSPSDSEVPAIEIIIPSSSSPSVTSPDAAVVAKSPPPVHVYMSNLPMKSNVKLKRSPMSPKIESSSSLPLPAMPIKSTKQAEGGWSLRPSLVAKYLGSTKVFPIYPPPVAVHISRPALSEAYGLPGMGLLWVSKSKRNPLRVMMPTYEVNPEMPRAPGEPGILLSCREEMCKNGPWTLFVKVGEIKAVRWNYAGEYISQTVGRMSKEDFHSQDAAVKKVWGKKIAKHKRHLVYRKLRARITIRKANGRDPTDEETADEAARIKSKDYTSSLTWKDVVKAFERGEEFINIVKTECVAYNHSRAKEYARSQKTYEAIVKAEVLFSDAERKRSREARKKKRPLATVPVPYDASIIPERLAGVSGTHQETLVSSSSAVQNTDWFFGDSDLTELDESASGY